MRFKQQRAKWHTDSILMTSITGIVYLQNNQQENPLDRLTTAISPSSPADCLKVQFSSAIRMVLHAQTLKANPPSISQDNDLFVYQDGWSAPLSQEHARQLHNSSTAGEKENCISDREMALIDDKLIVSLDELSLSMIRSFFYYEPIYYQLTNSGIAFSSRKRILAAIGLERVTHLAPGQMLSFTWEGNLATNRKFRPKRPEVIKDHSREQIVADLKQALLRSMERMSQRSVGVLFSGGIDSSLIAMLSKKYCKDALLITTCSPDSRDRQYATKAAQLLGMEHIVVNIDEEVAWMELENTMRAIGRTNLMDIEIAMPFMLAAREAKKRGIDLILSGQGPDELFAGYARYVRILKECGEENLADALWQDISTTHEKNIGRDILANETHGVSTYFPYLSRDFVLESLSVPPSLNIDAEKPLSRKLIFRELAKDCQLPQSLAEAQKKATQYSSGSAKAILTAVRKHVPEFNQLTRREVISRIQDYLDTSVADIGIVNMR